MSTFLTTLVVLGGLALLCVLFFGATWVLRGRYLDAAREAAVLKSAAKRQGKPLPVGPEAVRVFRRWAKWEAVYFMMGYAPLSLDDVWVNFHYERPRNWRIRRQDAPKKDLEVRFWAKDMCEEVVSATALAELSGE